MDELATVRSGSGVILVATGASSARASTARLSTRSFWRPPWPSRIVSSSTSAEPFARSTARCGSRSTTPSMSTCLSSHGCTPAACLPTRVSGSLCARSGASLLTRRQLAPTLPRELLGQDRAHRLVGDQRPELRLHALVARAVAEQEHEQVWSTHERPADRHDRDGSGPAGRTRLDSPGGSIAGLPELADEVYRAATLDERIYRAAGGCLLPRAEAIALS